MIHRDTLAPSLTPATSRSTSLKWIASGATAGQSTGTSKYVRTPSPVCSRRATVAAAACARSAARTGSSPARHASSRRVSKASGRLMRRFPWGSKAAAVVVVHRDRVQVDVLQAAHVDRGHRLALRVDALAERMDAAGRAEAVLDDVAVEGVGGQRVGAAGDLQPGAGHEPQQRALALAHGAVARQHAV